MIDYLAIARKRQNISLGLLIRSRVVLALMVVLQVVWLTAIWLSGTATQWQKLPFLLVYSVGCGVLVAWMPTDAAASLRRRAQRVWTGERRTMSLLFLGVLLVGSVYATMQHGWPDETHVFSASRVVAEQGMNFFFEHYSQITWLGTQHPPLVPLVYGSALSLFGIHLVVIRLVSLVFSLGSLSLTYAIGRELYDRQTGVLAAVLLVCMPFFFRIGATALTDMPTTFFFLTGVYGFLRLHRAPSYRLAVLVGLSVGAGLLCRYTMVFLYLLLFGDALLQGSWRRLFPYLVVVIFVPGTLLMMWLGYAAYHGLLEGQFQNLLHHAGSTLTTSWGVRWLFESVFLRLPSGIGIYNVPLLLLGGWLLVWQRSRSDLFLLVWMSAVCLPLIFTLPGPRYFFPAFPAFALTMVQGLGYMQEGAARVVLLALLYAGGNLHLFVDWYRAAGGEWWLFG